MKTSYGLDQLSHQKHYVSYSGVYGAQHLSAMTLDTLVIFDGLSGFFILGCCYHGAAGHLFTPGFSGAVLHWLSSGLMESRAVVQLIVEPDPCF